MKNEYFRYGKFKRFHSTKSDIENILAKQTEKTVEYLYK